LVAWRERGVDQVQQRLNDCERSVVDVVVPNPRRHL
jgi:hypothetical protein